LSAARVAKCRCILAREKWDRHLNEHCCN
jgi:hypothetical protein